MELSLRRVIPTQLIGHFWRGAYFSSFAPLQVQNIPRQPLPSPYWVRVRNRLAGICGKDPGSSDCAAGQLSRCAADESCPCP